MSTSPPVVKSRPARSDALQWIGRQPEPGEVVLLTERHEDARAVRSVLDGDGPAAELVTVAVLPGGSYGYARLAAELAHYGPSTVYLLVGSDEIGREWAAHAADWLGDAGIRALPPAFDRWLADRLAGAEPAAWLAEILADAEAVP